MSTCFYFIFGGTCCSYEFDPNLTFSCQLNNDCASTDGAPAQTTNSGNFKFCRRGKYYLENKYQQLCKFKPNKKLILTI